jgi:hypothetical protein
MPFMNQKEHCDTWAEDFSKPKHLRWWILLNRLPASLRRLAQEYVKPWPALYARHNGVKVRVVMASRFGDVGITTKLNDTHGYSLRVRLSQLEEFSDTP